MLQAECPNDLRSLVFDSFTPITWHRVSHYQRLTLKLIATEMLRHSPPYAGKNLRLTLPGEITVSKLTLTERLVLFCSAGNPGECMASIAIVPIRTCSASSSSSSAAR